MSKSRRKSRKLVWLAVLLVASVLAFTVLPLRRLWNENRTEATIREIFAAEKSYYGQAKCFGDLAHINHSQVKHGFRFMVAFDCNQFLVFAMPAQTQGTLRTGDYWFRMNSDGTFYKTKVRKEFRLPR